MLNLNKVFVIGNLTRDPEKSVTRNNNPVCTMSVAVNRKVKDGDAVCFFDVTAWGELGCTCVKFLKKGDPVFIEGHMSQDRWIDQTTGKENILRIEITVKHIGFVCYTQCLDQIENNAQLFLLGKCFPPKFSTE